MAEKYIIGNGPAPDWCRGRLMHYLRMDGKTGYEFHGWDKDFSLRRGDQLILRSGKIEIKRAGRR